MSLTFSQDKYIFYESSPKPTKPNIYLFILIRLLADKEKETSDFFLFYS